MKMPIFSGRELINLLKGIGFKVVAQKGSHSKLKKGNVAVIVPDEDQLAQKTLLSIIDQANLSSEEILSLMGEGTKLAPVEEAQEVVEGGWFAKAYNWKTTGFSIAICRIIVGILFTILAIESAPWSDYYLFNLYLKHSTEAATSYSFMISAMQANPGLFGWIFFFSALLVGLSLISGTFVPLFSGVGILWVINQGLMLFHVKTEWFWTYALWIMLLIVIWRTKSGRILGMDKKLAERFGPRRTYNTFWKFMNKLV